MILSRYAYLDTATLGRLTIRSYDRPLRTLERPWIPGPSRGGASEMSCVPDGRYLLTRRVRANGDPCLLVRNPDLGVYGEASEVPAAGGRSLIEIHSANYARQLLGCIAPGLELIVGSVSSSADIGDAAMVTSSKTAVQLVLTAFDAGDTELEIVAALGARDLT